MRNQNNAFTTAEQLSRLYTPSSKLAFTMAEILISLTIIGVIAAITLPSLRANINEKTWATQRKALYSRMSQAISILPSLNGYGVVLNSDGTINDIQTASKATQSFITDGLSGILKINNICDSEHFSECGLPTKFSTMEQAKIEFSSFSTLYSLNGLFSKSSYIDEFSYSTKDTKAFAFETQNNESIVAYYNPYCRTEYFNEGLTAPGLEIGFPLATMCVNFIYDLNGKHGPNKVGKDIGFITVFNSIDSVVVAPMPSSATDAGSFNWVDSNGNGAVEICKKIDSNSRIPNIDELSAMLVNRKLINLTLYTHFWSGTTLSNTKAWFVSTDGGCRMAMVKNAPKKVRCIKR